VIFNVSEIAPQGVILCVKGMILLNARFGGRFLRVKMYQNSELIPKVKAKFATLEPIHLMHFQLHVL